MVKDGNKFRGELIKTRVFIGFIVLLITPLAFSKQDRFLPSNHCPSLIQYTHYSVCYQELDRQAAWVKYTLRPEQVDGKAQRTNDYRPDMDVADPVYASDYRGSGYDRGHLVPAADMKQDHHSMSQTFFMTNMSPQVPSFNRGIWASMERHFRSLVRRHGEAHVITAPILENGLRSLMTAVSIPQWYYKIIYFPQLKKARAFLVENRKHTNAKVLDFEVTIDDLEAITGFDFFVELPDALEAEIESRLFDL